MRSYKKVRSELNTPLSDSDMDLMALQRLTPLDRSEAKKEKRV